MKFKLKPAAVPNQQAKKKIASHNKVISRSCLHFMQISGLSMSIYKILAEKTEHRQFLEVFHIYSDLQLSFLVRRTLLLLPECIPGHL